MSAYLLTHPDRSLMRGVSGLSGPKVHHSRMTKRSLTSMRFLALTGAALMMATAVHSGNDDADQALARKALQEGRIRALSDITEQVKTKLPGTILAVELEVEDYGRIVYEFKVVDPSGKLMEVEVDAATAEIVSIEDDD